MSTSSEREKVQLLMSLAGGVFLKSDFESGTKWPILTFNISKRGKQIKSLQIVFRSVFFEIIMMSTLEVVKNILDSSSSAQRKESWLHSGCSGSSEQDFLRSCSLLFI